MKWFKFPFGVTGVRVAIPEDLQPSGDVSYEEGYGTDYSRDPVTDPLAKRIERGKFNQLAYDITNWIRDLTIIGTPDFITTAQNGGVPYSYQAGARVMFDDGSGYMRWESLVGGNTSSPLSDPTKWRKVGKQGTETLMGIFKVATSAQAAAMVDDTVVITPAKLANSPISAKAWVNWRYTGGTLTVLKSINVSSVVRTAEGRYRITFTNPMVDVNYVALISNSAGIGGTSGSVYSPGGWDGAPADKTINTLTVSFGNGVNYRDCYDSSVVVFN